MLNQSQLTISTGSYKFRDQKINTLIIEKGIVCYVLLYLVDTEHQYHHCENIHNSG